MFIAYLKHDRNDATVQFIRSQKKNAQLVCKNFIFNKKVTQINGHTTWRCVDMTRLKCRALITTKNGQLLRFKGLHNHNNHSGKLIRRVRYDVENKIDEYVEVKSPASLYNMVGVVDKGKNFELVVHNYKK